MAADPSSDRKATATEARPRDRRSAWRARSRWAVHLGLLVSAAGALATLQLLHVRIAYHTVVGLIFVGLVALHLVQRRRTLAGLAAQLVGVGRRVRRRAGLAVSDVILLLVTLNVVVSGFVDWGRGTPSRVPLPKPFFRWHLDAGLVLVVYLIVHVWHRRKRLRRSTIR